MISIYNNKTVYISRKTKSIGLELQIFAILLACTLNHSLYYGFCQSEFQNISTLKLPENLYS